MDPGAAEAAAIPADFATVAFGCNFPGETDLAHQAEEYTTIDKMMLNIRIFAHAIAALAGK